MRDDERRALAALRFDSALAPDHVWRDPPFHVDGLYGDVSRRIRAGFGDARNSPDASPIGIAIQGRAGTGKTHLLGWVRRQVQAGDGYFFLVSLVDGNAFWKSTTLSIVDGLVRPGSDDVTQLGRFLSRLTDRTRLPTRTVRSITGASRLTRPQLDAFIMGVRGMDRPVGLECGDTLRALTLLGCNDMRAQDVGYSYLQSREETEPGERSAWGIHPEAKSPPMLIREIFRLLAMTGPSVVAVDQIDTLVAQSATSTAGDGEGDESAAQIMLINQLADGLMSFREITRRTLTLVASIPATWTLIREKAIKTVSDRFDETTTLTLIPSVELGRNLVTKRFRAKYGELDFKPPYETWPIRPEAFEEAVQFTPRRLIRRVNEHIQSCLDSGAVSELWSLMATDVGPPEPPSPPPSSTLDARFDELRRAANVQAALLPATEDASMPELLAAGLAAWIEERNSAQVFAQDPLPGSKPGLHARLRQSLNDSADDEQHWAFRAISHDTPIAALNRIQAARTAAGLSQGISKRKLFLLRNAPWSGGKKTQEAIADFTAAGGLTLPIKEDDLRTFAALKQLLIDRDPDLHAWLVDRRPASQTVLLKAALGDINLQLADVPADELEVRVATEPAPHPGLSIILGEGLEDSVPLAIGLESLCRHTAIFAGSGSGKTVLIRRLLEESALQGVSSIVLDPNNDLARLGDAWPHPPSGWRDGDAAKAADFLANTDVVVWTPRWEGGRPLSFQPLPDFRTVIGDVDEFNSAIDTAVASLAPRAKVDGTTAKADRGRAVLTETLRNFAQQGRTGLRQFIGELSTLPDGVSTLEDAAKIAYEMSQNLTAAMVNDPLFGGGGVPVDPSELLAPPPGKRARISVISFIGLPSDDQRQSFVNQLQMTLFAWIKRNPAGDRPLGGLLVMDEAQTLAPSGAMTACTQSTLALVSQARKYGLGLVFATQAPKGLHNRIPGNAATQFFGLLNAPVQIEAAKEMARAKSGDVSDISRLGTGQFYASGEGFSFQKVQTPLCLSYHPRSPLTTEEVVQRARRNRDPDMT